MHWDKKNISNETYRAKLIKLPEIINYWLRDFGGLAGKDVLDFGCGEATTALGVLLTQHARRVVGVDVMPDMRMCATNALEQLGMEKLPPNLDLRQVTPGELHDPSDKFDIIYSWSVFEHIEWELLPGIIQLLHSALKPGGKVFIQIAPLYFSLDGGHLLEWVQEPWGHLTNQHNVYLRKLHAACSSEQQYEALRSMFETLNRLTAGQLIEFFMLGGFRVLEQYRSDRVEDIPQKLLDVYNSEVLLNEQVVILLECA